MNLLIKIRKYSISLIDCFRIYNSVHKGAQTILTYYHRILLDKGQKKTAAETWTKVAAELPSSQRKKEGRLGLEGGGCEDSRARP